jgi:hypothetical protein
LEGDPWNITLAKRIAETFITGLERLKEMKAFTFRLIEYIPLPAEFTHNPYCANIAKNILDGIKIKTILRSKSGDWISPNQGTLAPDGLASLFDDADLAALNSYWPPPKFVSESYTQKDLLRKLGCRVLDWQDVRQIIQRHVFDFSVRPKEAIAKLFIYLNGQIKHDKDHLLNLRFSRHGPQMEKKYGCRDETTLF